VNPSRHDKSKRPPAVKPISWHSGWQEIGAPVGEPPTKAGGPGTDSMHEDQSRVEAGHRVELSTESTVLRRDGSRVRQYLFAIPEPRDDDAAPRVLIGRNEDRGLAATLDEARRFAREILKLVDEQEI
jgi:PAS domain-containing protein